MKLNPDPRIRIIGLTLIALSLVHIAIGLVLILR